MLEAISFPQKVLPPAPPSPKGVLKTKNLELSSWEIKKVISSTELVVLKWYPWHAIAVKALGPEKYLELAAMAKQGNEPQTLFSWLLKQEMS